MDDNIKQALLSRFSAYLDTVEDGPGPLEDPGEAADLYSVFVEVAGLRSEVRTESRLVKEALDQFRARIRGLLFRTCQWVRRQQHFAFDVNQRCCHVNKFRGNVHVQFFQFVQVF